MCNQSGLPSPGSNVNELDGEGRTSLYLAILANSPLLIPAIKSAGQIDALGATWATALVSPPHNLTLLQKWLTTQMFYNRIHQAKA